MRPHQQGFAIIQVIIAASIMSVLALAMANLITEQRKSVVYLEDQLSKIQLIRNFETILKDGLSCQKSLNGVEISPDKNNKTNITDIKNNEGLIEYKSNTDIEFIKINQITLKNRSVSGPDSSGFVDISIPLSRVRNGSGPKDLKPLSFKVFVTVDGAMRVTSCSSSSSGDLMSSAGSFTRSMTGHFSCVNIGNIGADRKCFGIPDFRASYRYNSAGCRYNKIDGSITMCASQVNMTCEYFCFDKL